MAEVTIVCGPPGSGKSTYVKEHAQAGELIVDLDAIMSALSGMPLHHAPSSLLDFAIPARDAVVARLRSETRVLRAWVIATLANPSERLRLAESLKASVVMLDVPADECLARLAKDETRPAIDMTAAVNRWWEEFGDPKEI